MPKQKTASRLKGKTVYYYRDPGGYRSGTVKRVQSLKSGKIKALRVMSSCGHAYRLTVAGHFPDRLPCGVLFRGKIQPITDWQEVAS